MTKDSAELPFIFVTILYQIVIRLRYQPFLVFSFSLYHYCMRHHFLFIVAPKSHYVGLFLRELANRSKLFYQRIIMTTLYLPAGIANIFISVGVAQSAA